MRIEIESDVFDIVDRIREIDDGYRIMYNTKTNKLELHNINQINSFCFNIKNNEICCGLISEIICTNIRHIDTIMEYIDNNNTQIETNNNNNVKDLTAYMAKEVFAFASNSSKEFDCNNVFKSKWR